MNCSSKNTVKVSSSFTFDENTLTRGLESAKLCSYLTIFTSDLFKQVTNSHLDGKFQNTSYMTDCEGNCICTIFPGMSKIHLRAPTSRTKSERSSLTLTPPEGNMFHSIQI